MSGYRTKSLNLYIEWRELLLISSFISIPKTMIREPLRVASYPKYTVRCHIPLEWEPPDEMTLSPCFSNGGSSLDSFAALDKYLPSNVHAAEEEHMLDSFSCDEFRMYEFKVRKCTRGRSHDWTECPYAHPGEKARRRDPRRHHYSGIACHEFRKSAGCKKGDTCEFGHGVFECWLHPARYRTQPCKDGTACRRRVCFFAHTPEQLRVLPFDFDHRSFFPSSPPLSPSTDSPMSPSSPEEIMDLVGAMRGMHLGKMKMGVGALGYLGSPMRSCGSTTPTRSPSSACSHVQSEIWDMTMSEEGPMMERVESGRDIRAQMYAKLSRENSLGREKEEPSFVAPDVGWVSDLLQ